MSSKSHIEIHGHRGARGLFPENTLTGFIEAVKIGVDFLEMDVVISKDNKVVVSHEAWMNPDFCTRPDGREVEANSSEKYNLYEMNYAEIVRYDCGGKGNREFPTQASISEHKPLLSEVVEKVDAYTKTNHLSPVRYNIEIKSEIQDNRFNPEPRDFVNLVIEEIKRLNIASRIILQSFDLRILQELKKKDDSLPISLLIEEPSELENNLKNLGFDPDIYAPEFHLIDRKLVRALESKSIKLITWTVNEVADMQKMIEMGVKGIITDYPDRLKNLLRK